MDYNEKTMMREVHCPKCKTYLRTNSIAPKCAICDSRLITVVNSILTNEKITGAKND